MKKIAALGLLVLLLYNTFGLAFAIFFFENEFQTASPLNHKDDWQVVKMYLPSLPYSQKWENTDGIDGLIKDGDNFYNATHVVHQDDTLYVTLKSNLSAREQFFELANMMEKTLDICQTAPENPHNKAIKLLNNLLKNYIPIPEKTELECFAFEFITKRFQQIHKYSDINTFAMNLNTPPPETV